MNLLQIREQFRKISGRFDLVNADFSDNGADVFINEGRKYLDRLDETKRSWGTCFQSLAVDAHYVTFPYCRAIKEVWVSSSTDKWQLIKKSLQDLVAGYFSEIDEITSGTPLYYAPTIARYIPESLTSGELEAFNGYLGVPPIAQEYNAVLLNVPTDTALSVIIQGLFYSAELVDDTDTNYWSEEHPLLLISAAMRQLEITQRNTQGVNDWTAAINTDVQLLGYDLVEELIAETDQMED